jgi:hypothetical protein
LLTREANSSIKGPAEVRNCSGVCGGFAVPFLLDDSSAISLITLLPAR